MGLARNTTLAASIMLASSALAEEIEIQWVNPTQNIDDSPVSTLSAFTLYKQVNGTFELVETVPYISAPLTSALFNLDCGDYVLAGTVTDAEGDESGFSNTVTRQIACPPPPDSIPRPPILLSGDNTGLLFFSPTTVFNGNIAEIQLYDGALFTVPSGRFVVEFTTDVIGGVMFSRDESGTAESGHLTMSINDQGQVNVRHQSLTETRVIAGGTVLIGQPHTAEYIFGPTGATLLLDGIIVAQDNTWTLGIDGNSLPFAIGASQASVVNNTDYRNPFDGELTVKFYNE
tara:strand:+ start:338 stop:1201 length:864 start_codon:yes stop_codon:yes gene_type:complete